MVCICPRGIILFPATEATSLALEISIKLESSKESAATDEGTRVAYVGIFNRRFWRWENFVIVAACEYESIESCPDGNPTERLADTRKQVDMPGYEKCPGGQSRQPVDPHSALE